MKQWFVNLKEKLRKQKWGAFHATVGNMPWYYKIAGIVVYSEVVEYYLKAPPPPTLLKAVIEQKPSRVNPADNSSEWKI